MSKSRYSKVVSGVAAGLVVALVMVLGSVGLLWAAGTCSESFASPYYLEFTWGGNGTITCTSSTRIDGEVLWVETIPGTVKPTDNYDIALTNADGRDIMGTSTLNRDNATIEIVQPKIGSTPVSSLPVNSLVTLTVTNNAILLSVGNKVRVNYLPGW